MKKAIRSIIATALLVLSQTAFSQVLSQRSAIALAEKFVLENGYTNAGQEKLKRNLDPESIEWERDRSKILEFRRNTLQPKAIGAKREQKGSEPGWSIAFDYVTEASDGRDICRVVTMNTDGSNIHIQHVDGFRKYFQGFNQPMPN